MDNLKRKQVKKPVQSRGIARYERILKSAGALIVSEGINAATAYRIAEHADLPAASVYQYFPSRELIFETLAERQFQLMMTQFRERMASEPLADWRDLVTLFVRFSYQFYTSSKLNVQLFLGIDTTANVRQGAGERLTEFARFFSAELEKYFSDSHQKALLEPVAISVNLADGAFQRSLSLYGEIRPEYYDEALKAVLGYLACYFDSSP